MSPANVVTWPYRAVRGAVAAFRLWRQLQADADARICLGLKRQQEILSDRLREAQERGDKAEEDRVRHMLHRVQDNELAYQQSRIADLAAHIVADRAPTGAIGPDLPKLPEPERESLGAAVSALKALVAAQTFEQHFLRGNALYAAQDFESALQEHNAALELCPDDPDTLNNRANALDELRRYEEALADYNRSLQLRPDNPVVLNNRSAALTALQRYEEALADCNRSLQLQPDDPDTLSNRGSALGGLKRYEEALADFNRSLELRPDHPEVLNNHGVALRNLGHYQEALADYNRSLELRPDDPATLHNRGRAYSRVRRYEEALTDFNEVLRLQPHNAGTIYDIACLYSLWGRYDESLQWLEKAIAGDAAHRAMAAEDEDFASLRADPEFGPRFQKLIEEKNS